MNSDVISSLYTVPSHLGGVAEVLGETSFARVTFAGRVIHSMVDTCFFSKLELCDKSLGIKHR